MATIRANILKALVTRLEDIPGWNVQLRGAEQTGNHPIAAVVFLLGEDKPTLDSQDYTCRLTVGVEITARVDDASESLDDGNPFLYIDRLVGLAEKQIHSPDSWGLEPDFTDVRIDGHDVADPPLEHDWMVVEALLRLTFTYKHDAVAGPEVA